MEEVQEGERLGASKKRRLKRKANGLYMEERLSQIGVNTGKVQFLTPTRQRVNHPSCIQHVSIKNSVT